ncbi:hypothetical protein H2200_006591 [Cladophialophora chaetospira]|uniref:Transcription factor domain-containing protein n=1 Tax=Cladophialophora chaetospira TaxID=386627 RepID=A0AA39CHU2_9EURO|nr:hypothetical protein H2200_006591 [Cladophialophora chaetospira]
MVLQDIDQPTFESVQTCEMLTLYWFSSGESQRNTMFSGTHLTALSASWVSLTGVKQQGIAYKAACTLGLDLAESSPLTNADTVTPESRTNTTWLEAERVRRCFWAVWFTQCINSDHSVVGTTYNDRVLNLSLPISETSFTDGVQQPLVNLSSVLQQHSNVADSRPGAPSIMAELMTLIFYWVKIRNLVRRTDRISGRDWLTELFELEGHLSTWSSQLPELLKYSKRNLYEQLVVLQQPVYTFVHALYHQCRLVLHSSIVPKFSGIPLDKAFPQEATALSARIALKSAQRISELGADIQALDWDPSQIASFVGYCMDTSLATPARSNLIASIRLLKSMKIYWTNLERLWIRINMLYGAQVAGIRRLVKTNASNSDERQAHLDELDELAGEPRDTGQLAEPLADSVLDYTLRRLGPKEVVDSASIRVLEETQYSDELSNLMYEGPKPTHAYLQPGPMREERNLYSSIPGQRHHTQPVAAQVSDFWDRTRAPSEPFSNSNNLDWWDLGLENIQQPILPYEDLFNLDFNVP